MKKAKIIAVFSLLTSVNIFGQVIGEIYKVDAQFSANQFLEADCQKDSVDIICKYATFKIVDVVNDIIKIKIIDGKLCDDFADNNGIYCVRKIVFTNGGSVHLKDDDKKWDTSLGGGILTIPFKFDRKSFKVFPAGEIGGVAGLKLSYNKTGGSIIIGGILGLSSIPLNDLNSNNTNEIKTVSGVTIGGGISINVAKGFQFGIYYGNDFYNTDNTKFSKDWISFGFGYDFFRFFEDAKKNKTQMITAPLN
jgi:hypothetical protein